MVRVHFACVTSTALLLAADLNVPPLPHSPIASEAHRTSASAPKNNDLVGLQPVGCYNAGEHSCLEFCELLFHSP
jgi:hypothetical protein